MAPDWYGLVHWMMVGGEGKGRGNGTYLSELDACIGILDYRRNSIGVNS